MKVFNLCLRRIIGRSLYQFPAKDGTNREFLIIPHKVVTYRSLVLSSWLKKDILSSATQKLDLDGWKDVVRSPLQEPNEKASESEEDSDLRATRDLIEMWRLSGKVMPENLKEEELKTLMECPTKTAKKKYLKFLAKKELLKKVRKDKVEKRKEAKKELRLKAPENSDGGLKNTFLMKFWSRSEDSVFNWRTAQSMMFGQPLVFDMAYENYMARRELQNTVNQMMESEGFNRRAEDPFHLHYCNLVVDSPYHKEFIKRYGETWDHLLVTVTEKAHVEIFPTDQLVYLTADSPNVMQTFDHNKIYIIGCFVDKSIQTGLSLARAKRLKLATARLPLDRYLQWEEGAKNLTLDQMMRILLTLKDTGDWKEALQFVPRRKHAGFVETAAFSKHSIETWKKTKRFDKKAGQENAFRPFATNFSRQEKRRKWWEDASE